MKKFLSINYSDGKLYETSKEEKEGFVEHKTSDGKTYYRHYYDKGVTGVFLGLKFHKWDRGDQIQAEFQSGEDTLVVSFRLKGSKGYIDNTFLQPFIQLLPNMEKGQVYTIFPYNFIPEGGKKAIKGVSVKQNGEKIGRAISMEYTNRAGEHTPGDIPQLEFKEDKLDGKPKPTAVSLEKRDEVIKEYLSNELDRLEVTDNHASTEVEPKAKSEEPKREEKPRPAPSKEPEAKTEKAAEETPKKKKLPF